MTDPDFGLKIHRFTIPNPALIFRDHQFMVPKGHLGIAHSHLANADPRFMVADSTVDTLDCILTFLNSSLTVSNQDLSELPPPSQSLTPIS